MIRQDFIFTCDHCRKRIEKTEEFTAGCMPLCPVLPWGWFKIEKYIFCDDHQIKIDDRILTRFDELQK